MSQAELETLQRMEEEEDRREMEERQRPLQETASDRRIRDLQAALNKLEREKAERQINEERRKQPVKKGKTTIEYSATYIAARNAYKIAAAAQKADQIRAKAGNYDRALTKFQTTAQYDRVIADYTRKHGASPNLSNQKLMRGLMLRGALLASPNGGRGGGGASRKREHAQLRLRAAVALRLPVSKVTKAVVGFLKNDPKGLSKLERYQRIALQFRKNGISRLTKRTLDKIRAADL